MSPEAAAAAVARFVKERTFFCPYLGHKGANISLEECVARQTRPEPKHRAKGVPIDFHIKPGVDVFCRSGECALGKQNLVKLGRSK